MQRNFDPIVRNPHLLTIAGNFWPRKVDAVRFSPQRREYQVDARNRIVVIAHQPVEQPAGHIVLLHGLEGSSNAGYIISLSQHALEHGFAVHRVNHRSCGESETLCEGSYHSGLTSDARTIIEALRDRDPVPIFLVGFSLGGNVALKLGGELGQTDLLAGICAVSTPIDLAACVRAMDKASNRFYTKRFVSRLRARVQRKSRTYPQLYDAARLRGVKTIWQFDDAFTAPLFGFGTAESYYATQSAARYLDSIRVPTLVICSKDDPMVPFEIYNHPAFDENPYLTLLATEHGGHLGFLSRKKPRFWLDSIILDWIAERSAQQSRGNVTRMAETGVS